MKETISAAVGSNLFQISGSENKSDGEDEIIPPKHQASSTNADKKVCLKSILNKSKRG